MWNTKCSEIVKYSTTYQIRHKKNNRFDVLFGNKEIEKK
jgi:hypothetical protein